MSTSRQLLLAFRGDADCYIAAISARLAQGADVPTAVRGACRYIEAGIKTAPQIGGGNGPLDHFHSTYTLPFSPLVFTADLLIIK